MSDLQVRGPLYGGTGTPSPFTADFSGAQRTADAHGRYLDAVTRGNMYGACQFAGTTIPAGLSASPTTLTLYNPAGSGKNAVILFASVTFLVAFAAASIIALAVSPTSQQAAVSGTAVVPINLLVGSQGQAVVKAFTTATLPSAPAAGSTVAIMGAGLTGAITTTPAAVVMSREFAGSLVLAPGTALSFQASTASGASGAAAEFIWEEVPVLV
jgi:hypothetical protein